LIWDLAGEVGWNLAGQVKSGKSFPFSLASRGKCRFMEPKLGPFGVENTGKLGFFVEVALNLQLCKA
jgi:hypothetical protein